MFGDERGRIRAPVSARVALVCREDSLGEFDVVNLSAAGALLIGRPPRVAEGELCALVRLPAGRMIRARAAIVRQEASGGAGVFAVAFSRLSMDDEDELQAAVVSALEDARRAHALIVDDSAESCLALQRDLERLGHSSFALSAPLDAVRFLHEPNGLAVALVDVALNARDGRDVLVCLAEGHPHVRRVLLSRDARSTALPATLVPGRHPFAHEVLVKPWTHESLARALAL